MAERPAADSGFTLIEVAIVLLIFSIVLVVFGDVLMSIVRAGDKGEALVANQQQVENVLTQLGRDLRSESALLVADSSELKMTLVNSPGNTASARTVTAAMTSGTDLLSASAATFSSSDVGSLAASGGYLPANTFIVGVSTDGSQATINNSAIQTGSAVVTVTPGDTADWTCSGSTLSRTLGVGGITSTNSFSLTGVQSCTPFTLYNLGGSAATPTTSSTSSTGCTARVGITLSAAPVSNLQPYSVNENVELRNQLAVLQPANIAANGTQC
ncbi:MAG TPA: prepilin-type N-terminal cleavage/methylation domain-containing protein [Acidimicrobiales bacterium]|nr:prepilin-type N-terminal cleavage/methylation domain-containing protein [Acidimicrobiales bacterium]